VEFLSNLLSVLIFITSLVLILIILVQRGRGGGLIGALGGSGGSSAFGSRAGDTFTRVTLILAGVWMLLIMVQIWIQPLAQG
jgi:preprotein translocase subunit SecG